MLSPYSPRQFEIKPNNLGVFVYPVGPEDRTGAPLRETFFVPDRHLAELPMMAFPLNGPIKSSLGHLIYSQSFLAVDQVGAFERSQDPFPTRLTSFYFKAEPILL